MKISRLICVAAFIYVAFLLVYSAVEYNFTMNRPIAPSASNGRVVETQVFYDKRVFVTASEHLEFSVLKYGTDLSFGLAIILGVLYWQTRR